MEQREAVIVDTLRTPIGKRKGALATWHPADLLGFALNALVDRTGVDPGRIDDVVAGCVSQVGEQSNNVARNAWAEDLRTSAETRKHLDSERELISGMLAELGLLKR